VVLGASALENTSLLALAKERIAMAIKPVNTDKVNRILIRSTNWIGDAIMTTPAVRAIRKNFSHAEISILAKPWVLPVFENNPHVDQCIVYDSSAKHHGILGKLKLARDLKPYHFDVAILLQNAFEAALISFLAQIPCRIGYNTDARGILLSHAVPLNKEIKNKHQTAYYLDILKGIGLDTDGQSLTLKVGEKYVNKADKTLDRHGVSSADSVVGINPGATYGPAKQWFPERFANLADHIVDAFETRIILFGGPEDLASGMKISQMMRHSPINLSGKTGLGEAMALIKRCKLFITNDSGLMHVAAALDVPLIAIFGSTNPATTGPWSNRSRVIKLPVECSPCLKPECPESHFQCMKQISVEMVLEVVKEIL
jgi:heptosyltransferase-2